MTAGRRIYSRTPRRLLGRPADVAAAQWLTAATTSIGVQGCGAGIFRLPPRPRGVHARSFGPACTCAKVGRAWPGLRMTSTGFDEVQARDGSDGGIPNA